MRSLEADETDLVGKWIMSDGKVVGDSTTERIEWLVSKVLTRIAFHPELGAWETLFRDPTDGRYWERTFPDSQMHGGGPPRLWHISEEEARIKYKLA